MKLTTVDYPLAGGYEENTPKIIVLHAMAEIIEITQNASDWYKSKGKDVPVGKYPAHKWLERDKTSAHRLIASSGIEIICRPDTLGAWHAKGFNRDSLGVEFLVPGIHTYDSFMKKMKTDWTTDEQITAGITRVKEWMQIWDIPVAEVHTHHKLSPNRKYDPGFGFPLRKFLKALED